MIGETPPGLKFGRKHPESIQDDVGMTGLLGFSSGYHAMMACDALLMLGSALAMSNPT